MHLLPLLIKQPFFLRPSIFEFFSNMTSESKWMDINSVILKLEWVLIMSLGRTYLRGIAVRAFVGIAGRVVMESFRGDIRIGWFLANDQPQTSLLLHEGNALLPGSILGTAYSSTSFDCPHWWSCSVALSLEPIPSTLDEWHRVWSTLDTLPPIAN